MPAGVAQLDFGKGYDVGVLCDKAGAFASGVAVVEIDVVPDNARGGAVRRVKDGWPKRPDGERYGQSYPKIIAVLGNKPYKLVV